MIPPIAKSFIAGLAQRPRPQLCPLRGRHQVTATMTKKTTTTNTEATPQTTASSRRRPRPQQNLARYLLPRCVSVFFLLFPSPSASSLCQHILTDLVTTPTLCSAGAAGTRNSNTGPVSSNACLPCSAGLFSVAGATSCAYTARTCKCCVNATPLSNAIPLNNQLPIFS